MPKKRFNDVEIASYLYKESHLKTIDVAKRIQSLHQQIPINYRGKFNAERLRQNLLLHLENCLSIEDNRYRCYRGDKEDFYTPDIGSLVVTILDIAEHEAPTKLPKLILGSPLIQTFGSDRSHSSLIGLETRTPTDTLALALVCLQRGQPDNGIQLLRELGESSIEELLLTYNEAVLHEDAFTELGLVLLAEFTQMLARVLSKLITARVASLPKIQKLLMGHFQPGGSLAKNAAEVLQTVLEKEMTRLVEQRRLVNSEAQETVGTLVCLYLTQLSQRWEAPSVSDPLFRELRPPYLDHLPPFGPDLNQILSPQTPNSKSENGEPKNVLIKLQCLLASEVAATSLYRVRVFLMKTPQVFGSLSIQVQCAAPPEALQLLLNFSPQGLIPYLKEKSLQESEWRNILNQINNRISAVTDPKRKFYYQQLEQGVLEHISQTLTLREAAELLPAELPGRNVCLRIAHDNEQASHIRALIMLTGTQLS